MYFGHFGNFGAKRALSAHYDGKGIRVWRACGARAFSLYIYRCTSYISNSKYIFLCIHIEELRRNSSIYSASGTAHYTNMCLSKMGK